MSWTDEGMDRQHAITWINRDIIQLSSKDENGLRTNVNLSFMGNDLHASLVRVFDDYGVLRKREELLPRLDSPTQVLAANEISERAHQARTEFLNELEDFLSAVIEAVRRIPPDEIHLKEEKSNGE